MMALRILHLPTTVGGNPQGISRHFCAKGINSRTWAFRQNSFYYSADYFIASQSDSRIVFELKRLFALRYVFAYDVVFFNFGQTLFPQLPSWHPFVERGTLYFIAYQAYRLYLRCMQAVEISLLTLLKRKLYVQYQGDDARQGDYSLQNFSINIASQVGQSYYSPFSDALKRSQIKLLSRICKKIYALNPDLLHVLPYRAEFLPYSSVDIVEIDPSFTQLERRPLRICHAPSHRVVKGTQFILDAVECLKSDGYLFEFILVENCSNSQAMQIYAQADLLVDQLFAGWYGGLAVELMALGKPVIAYIREDDMKYIPPQMYADLPIIRADRHSVYDVLRDVLQMPRDELWRLARKSRLFVERWHDPSLIAGRLLSDISS